MTAIEPKPKRRVGRPCIEINQEEFEKLAGMHCTLAEFAGWFKCSEDTIERWTVKTYGVNFADALKKYSAPGKISLRRKMFESAIGGNTTMMIWLSKQHLGMTDKVEQKTEVKTQQEIVYTAEWGGTTETPSHQGQESAE